VLVLLVAACGDGGTVATSSSTVAAWTTILPATTTTASVTIPQSTTTDVTSPWGTITGTLRDAGNGLPIGAMFEQGSGLIGVAVVGPDGVVVAWAENRGDGFFEASVAPGSYALLAGVEVYNASYWLPGLGSFRHGFRNHRREALAGLCRPGDGRDVDC